MTVIVKESVCYDCKGKETCQRLKRLRPGKTIRDELDELYSKVKTGEIDAATLLHKVGSEYRVGGKEVFEILIVNCSMKVQYNERERLAKNAIMNPEEPANFRHLFYCTICEKMHMTGSGIGIEHKKTMDEQKQEMSKYGTNTETERKSKDNTQKA